MKSLNNDAKRQFNYLAAAILVVAANMPFYLIHYFSDEKTIPVNVSLNVGLIISMIIFVPIITVIFLKRFSSGITLRNSLTLGIFISMGCLILDSLVIGFIFSLGTSFLQNWLFPFGYVEILILPPLTAYVYEKVNG